MKVLCKSFLIFSATLHIQIINKHSAYGNMYLQSLNVGLSLSLTFEYLARHIIFIL